MGSAVKENVAPWTSGATLLVRRQMTWPTICTIRHAARVANT